MTGMGPGDDCGRQRNKGFNTYVSLVKSSKYTQAHIYAYTSTHIYTHYMHTHPHIYTHIHTYTPVSQSCWCFGFGLGSQHKLLKPSGFPE